MSAEKERIPKSRRKSQKDAVKKYRKEHYDRISLNIPKGKREIWLAKALERGFKSLTPFIISCVNKEIGIDDSENSDTIVNN